MERITEKQNLVTGAAGILGSGWTEDRTQVNKLFPDGSNRKFYRLTAEESVICVCPPEGDSNGSAEAEAFYHIGRHLFSRKVPVPEMYGMTENAAVICEDLGNTRLYELYQQHGGVNKQVCALYEEAIRELVHMQVKGGEQFDATWCWDTQHYDEKLMMERESGYFLKAFCQEYMNIPIDYAVYVDCQCLADSAAQAPSYFFLHRDFQSRNIMVHADRIRFIDFQGGRMGPLAYDLASLLLDPYVSLEPEFCKHLMELYLEELNKYLHYDQEQFLQEYLFLALQRNMQILGAFAFLFRVKNKLFFEQFIYPALLSLDTLLVQAKEALPALQSLVRHCRLLMEKKS